MLVKLLTLLRDILSNPAAYAGGYIWYRDGVEGCGEWFVSPVKGGLCSVESALAYFRMAEPETEEEVSEFITYMSQ